MTRKEAREFAMQMVFQFEAQHEFNEASVEQVLKEKDTGSQKEYTKKLLLDICNNLLAIDTLINNNSQGWPTVRMAKTDLAIIRVAVGEIMFMEDIPRAVSINEAVNLAKLYGTEQSTGFINAILGKIDVE